MSSIDGERRAIMVAREVTTCRMRHRLSELDGRLLYRCEGMTERNADGSSPQDLALLQPWRVMDKIIMGEGN